MDKDFTNKHGITDDGVNEDGGNIMADKDDVIHAVIDNNLHINDDGSIEIIDAEIACLVYGPPSWFGLEDPADIDPVTGEAETLINEEPDVYGPDPSVINNREEPADDIVVSDEDEQHIL